MVRRWSCINNKNLAISNFRIFVKITKVFVFKSTVLYKRFTCKITKFKRKALIRVKHHTNWFARASNLSLWARDYVFQRHYCESQFLNSIYLKNFCFYNFNFSKNRNESHYYNFNFIFSTWSKRSYAYFYGRPFSLVKYSSITYAWYNAEYLIDRTLVPTTSMWGFNSFEPIKSGADGNLDKIFEFFFFTIFQKIFEIDKILNLLLSLQFLNFKNVK